jgi:hypothetical protein
MGEAIYQKHEESIEYTNQGSCMKDVKALDRLIDGMASID